MTDTLLAIDKTYRRWANILDLVREGKLEEAAYLLDLTTCSLCKLAYHRCSICPVAIEYKLDVRIAACTKLRIYKAAFDGVMAGDGSNRTISAIVRMLWILDCLWERVRKSEKYS